MVVTAGWELQFFNADNIVSLYLVLKLASMIADNHYFRIWAENSVMFLKSEQWKLVEQKPNQKWGRTSALYSWTEKTRTGNKDPAEKQVNTHTVR